MPRNGHRYPLTETSGWLGGDPEAPGEQMASSSDHTRDSDAPKLPANGPFQIAGTDKDGVSTVCDASNGVVTEAAIT
jgi:hypothetical protein